MSEAMKTPNQEEPGNHAPLVQVERLVMQNSSGNVGSRFYDYDQNTGYLWVDGIPIYRTFFSEGEHHKVRLIFKPESVYEFVKNYEHPKMNIKITASFDFGDA